MHGPNAKPEEEWTDDDMAALREYERKCKELNEARERHRKMLENELKKLEDNINEETTTFDALLTKVFLQKVKTEKAVCLFMLIYSLAHFLGASSHLYDKLCPLVGWLVG